MCLDLQETDTSIDRFTSPATKFVNQRLKHNFHIAVSISSGSAVQLTGQLRFSRSGSLFRVVRAMKHFWHSLLCLATPVFCQYAGDEYGRGAPSGQETASFGWDNQQVQGGYPDRSYGTAPGYPNSAGTAAQKKALAQVLGSVLADAAEEQAKKKEMEDEMAEKINRYCLSSEHWFSCPCPRTSNQNQCRKRSGITLPMDFVMAVAIRMSEFAGAAFAVLLSAGLRMPVLQR